MYKILFKRVSYFFFHDPVNEIIVRFIFMYFLKNQKKVTDLCWLDDQFLVSGSKDSKMALWRINEDMVESDDEKTTEETCPTYARVSALAVKECRAAQKIRSLCFNEEYKEIAVVSLNGYIHIFNAETFSQKLSRKLPNCQDNVCIASQPNGVYAVGCRSYTLLLDPRTLQVCVIFFFRLITTNVA